MVKAKQSKIERMAEDYDKQKQERLEVQEKAKAAGKERRQAMSDKLLAIMDQYKKDNDKASIITLTELSKVSKMGRKRIMALAKEFHIGHKVTEGIMKETKMPCPMYQFTL